MPAFDAFISHSSADKTFADAACASLERAGIRCWIAPRDIMAGSDWSSSIVDAIDQCRAMVLIFSASANESPQIRNELVQAANRGVPIIPVRTENVVPSKSLAYFVGAVHWLDAMSPPIEQHLQRLSESVKALLQIKPVNAGAATPPPPPPPPPVSRPPSTAEEYRGRIASLFQDKEYAAAIEMCNEALKLDPKNAFALMVRGECFNQLSKLDEAVRDLEEAVKLDATMAGAFIYLGNAYLGKGEDKQAVANFEKAIRLNPNSAYAYFSRGLTYYITRDNDRAIADLNEAIRLNPGYVEALKYRGDAYFGKNDYDSAVASYKEAQKIHPRDPEIPYRKGIVLVTKRDFEEAITAFDEALRLNPRNASALWFRGRSKSNLGDAAGGDADVKTARAIDPNVGR